MILSCSATKSSPPGPANAAAASRPKPCASDPAKAGTAAIPTTAAATWKPTACAAAPAPRRRGVSAIRPGNSGPSEKPVNQSPATPASGRAAGAQANSNTPASAPAALRRARRTLPMRATTAPARIRARVNAAQNPPTQIPATAGSTPRASVSTV